MTVPCLTSSEFITLLKENGYKVVNDAYWEQYDRIIISKGGHSFPFQVRSKYFFPMVVKLCEQLEIEPPADHKRCYDQHYARKKKKG